MHNGIQEHARAARRLNCKQAEWGRLSLALRFVASSYDMENDAKMPDDAMGYDLELMDWYRSNQG